MDQLPIWLGLKGRPVKVAGTGAAASAKARLAVQAGAAVTLFSPVLEEDAAELVSSGAVRFEARNFCPDDAVDAALMFSATGSESEDRIVAEAAKAAGVPVNVVDRPTLSTFLMPAIVDRGPVVVGISTGGASPALAVRIRAKIEAVLPHRLEALARFAGSFRLGQTVLQHSIPGDAGNNFPARRDAAAIGGSAWRSELCVDWLRRQDDSDCQGQCKQATKSSIHAHKLLSL